MHSFQKFIVVSFPTTHPPCRNKDMEISCESAVQVIDFTRLLQVVNKFQPVCSTSSSCSKSVKIRLVAT